MQFNDLLPERSEVVPLTTLFVALSLALYAWGEAAAARGTTDLPWEAAVRDRIQRTHLQDATVVMRAVSLLSTPGAVAIVTGLLGLRLRASNRHAAARFLATSGAGMALLHPLVKGLVNRARPHFQERRPLKTSSYPSGHAVATTTIAAMVGVLAWPSRWRLSALTLGTLWVLLASANRIALEEHHPSDVLAGIVAALTWVLGVQALTRHRQRGTDA